MVRRACAPPARATAPTSPPARGVATFCRLEHVVPWVIRGAHWEAAASGGAGPDEVTERAHGAAALPDARVVVVRERGEARVHDGLCSIAHLLAWAKAGGRYR